MRNTVRRRDSCPLSILLTATSPTLVPVLLQQSIMKAKLMHLIPPPLQIKNTLAERILQPIFTIPGVSSSSSSSAPAPAPTDDFSTGSGSNSSPAYPIGILSQSQIIRHASSPAAVPIEIFEVHPHPASPILAYVDYGSDDFLRLNNTHGIDLNPTLVSHSSNSKDILPPPASVFLNHKDPHRQRIVIQNYQTRRTLKTISMLDITRDVVMGSSSNRSSTSPMIPKGDLMETCQRLGYIQNISFLDVDSAFVLGGMMDTSIAAAQSNPGFPMSYPPTGVDPSTTNHETMDDWVCEKAPPCLIIYFKSRILVYSIAHDIMTTTFYSPPMVSPIRAHVGTKALHNAKPSCYTAISLLTPNLIAIGCSDGVIRFYNIILQKVVLAILGPNGRSDPIVQMISTNPSCILDVNNRVQNLDDSHRRNNERNHTSTDSEEVSSSHNTKNKSSQHTTLKSRFLTVYQSGDSFLWETTFKVNTRDGNVEKIKIRPPLCRLDFSWVENNHTTVSTSAPSSSTSSYPISVHKSRIVYDSERDWILWTTVSETLLGSKHYIFAWDISPSSLSKNLLSVGHGVDKDKDKPEIPSLRRLITLLIPSNELSDPVASEVHVVPGLLHPSFSPSSLVSFMGTFGGDLALCVASCGFNQQESPISQQKLVAYHHFNLVSLLRSSDESVVGVWNTVNEDKIKIFSIHAGPQGDIVLLSTNIGTAVLRLEDESILQCGSRHVCVSVDNFGCHIGVGNGIIFVEESSIFYGNLHFKSSQALPNPVGRMNITDIVPLYKSPPPLHKSNEFQNRPSRIPPRILPSPSGAFLCFFWHAESRYEILHLSSLLSTVNTAKRRKELIYSPAVDTGVNVLSFAWVGDDDMFALLHPPEMIKETDGTSALNKDRKKSSTRRTTEDDDEDRMIFDPSKYLPGVELKHLVGVNQNGVEISGSVGAATAVSLGDLQLRGRYSAVCLFGGPVLCVASILDHKDSGHVDGAAFFYNLREDSHDKKSASFVTVGPSLPFPDYVEWDDDGKLCAIVVGWRIFIYKSVDDTFTHLGSVRLEHSDEYGANIQSVKFLHGSLYCSTQSTVQVIFLGNLDDDNKICEIDSYILASSKRPCTYLSITMDPIPTPAILKSPTITVASYSYGSLLVSCASSLYTIPISHPLLRIGLLLAAKQKDRADKWISLINPKDHEFLALFLERRGVPELAVKLPGLSIATAVDLCLRYGMAEQLENLVENVGTKRIRDIDNGCGPHGSSTTAVVSVGSFLLGLGKVELVRCMATECLNFGDDRGRREAFTLASLLISVEPMDGQRLIKRAVGIGNKGQKEGSTWLLGDFVKEHILQTSREQLK